VTVIKFVPARALDSLVYVVYHLLIAELFNTRNQVGIIVASSAWRASRDAHVHNAHSPDRHHIPASMKAGSVCANVDISG
jgi:hypothetical protein